MEPTQHARARGFRLYLALAALATLLVGGIAYAIHTHAAVGACPHHASLLALSTLCLILLCVCGGLLWQLQKRTQPEAPRHEDEWQHALILDNINACVYTKRPDGTYTYANQALASFFGCPVDEIIGKTDADFFSPESAAQTRQNDARVFSEAKTILKQETEHVARSGKTGTFLTTKIPHCAPDGTVIYLVGISTDVTETQQANARIAKIVTALSQAAEGIVITDADGAIEYVNPAFTQITGYSQEEAIGQNPRLLKSNEEQAAVYADLWKTLAAEATWKGRLINKRKDGSLYTQDTTISPVRDDKGHVSNYVAVTRDVSEELQLQEQLTHAQKMESIGRLAGGVAHDFNNLLMGIMGYTEMARDKLPSDHPANEDLGMILSSIKRTTDVTKQLLVFAHKQPSDPQPLDPNEAIAKLIKMLGHLIGESIKLKWEPAQTVWLVKVDPGQVDQMLANLCINARDAIRDTGTITISTYNKTLHANDCKENIDATPGAFVCIRVQDNGCGMSDELVAQIFDPFFTTKDAGKGTGLGLSTVYGIVTQNGGWIDVASTVGEGTTFYLYLPRFVGKQQDVLTDKKALPPPISKGNETILLVEDDKSVRDVSLLFLQQLQYDVLTATDPEEALQLAQSHAKEIKLLLTDVVMPGMNGVTLAQKLVETIPGIRVVFMSGYTEDILSSHGLETHVELLSKPFSRMDIATAVRRVLDAG